MLYDSSVLEGNVTMKVIYRMGIEEEQDRSLKDWLHYLSTSEQERPGATIKEKLVLEGEIITHEARKLRNGNFIHKGSIYDGTSTVEYSFFDPQEIKVEVQSRVKIAGKIARNRYTPSLNREEKRGDWTIEVERMVSIEQRNLIDFEDNEDEKRVELQVFTNDTKARGISTFEEVLDCAKKMGHSAVALTDLHGVYGFPKGYKEAKKRGIKPLLGTTISVVEEPCIIKNDLNQKIADTRFFVFDLETTGLSGVHDDIIEFAFAVVRYENGKWVVLKEDSMIIQTDKKINDNITAITSITQDQIDQEGISREEAVRRIQSNLKDTCLVAHNAGFDARFLYRFFKEDKEVNVKSLPLLDTLQLSLHVNNRGGAHSLGKLAKQFNVPLVKAHRALDDTLATVGILKELLFLAEAKGIKSLNELNSLIHDKSFKTLRSNEVSVLVRNKKGLKNLNDLISYSLTEGLSTADKLDNSSLPVVPLSVLEKYREGLLIGSGSHEGRLFNLALNGSVEEAAEDLKRYDYIEIQPSDISNHLWNHPNPKVSQKGYIEKTWKTIYDLSRKEGKEIVATGYVHYTAPALSNQHNIAVYNEYVSDILPHEKRQGLMDYPQGPCHFRSTKEMMDDLAYLDHNEAKEAVVHASNRIANMIEDVAPIPLDENGSPILHKPVIEGADEELSQLAYETAYSMYGNPLPSYVEERLKRELEAVIGNGYAVIYLVSARLVKKSNEDGYLVGSRGSIGSSFAATMAKITEVNPLIPHYRCSHCAWSLFLEHKDIKSGYDLPSTLGELFDNELFKEEFVSFVIERFSEEFGISKSEAEMMMKSHVKGCCPKCKKNGLIGDGHNIPFETFLGFKGDKIPDIDLNFANDYQSTAHKFIGSMFEKGKVFRAGTISRIQDKTAFAIVNGYHEGHGLSTTRAEVVRLMKPIVGTRKTTGSHPGGVMVVPKGMEMTDIGPYQYSANEVSEDFCTTHYEYHDIHDSLCKFDLLGHKDPMFTKLLEDLTGIDPKTIPINDQKVMDLWRDTEAALGVSHEQFMAKTGTLGLPEMHTRVVQDMITETKPKRFSDLVILSGLSHGTDVYYNNAQDLIQNGTCSIQDVIGCRDDIMRYLIERELEPFLAFQIMESVRKGKGLKEEWEKAMIEKGVPQWYIDSCKKIKYMFPQAHAIAYVMAAVRTGYFKVYHDLSFYSGIFSARFSSVNVQEFYRTPQQMRERIEELKNETDAPSKITKVALNIALEASVRGVKFGRIKMYQSAAKRYRMDPKTNTLIPPYSSIPGVGDVVALKIEEEQQKGVFRGLNDFIERTGAKKGAIRVLRENGCFELIEEDEYEFF